ncbi:hypothetical protein COS54_03630 [Candidatus Shapirobacteria bacterium CG03_land_8_20_14_0_80_39_12]|uniref:Glycosyl transferase family 1 domain-containing protein n=1 Tax=Candidatus Shapirobacteria bacterium CG03_land_8_20_14_0_80_39_12 TaxID=1974879 RepID=A0A2M7BAV9_9BACT|nr:MAG: hypothetical protein COS54_03630 [Candidatus Shapirobacteria bacterium CG03_land_8_20_14_0_80_39_12]
MKVNKILLLVQRQGYSFVNQATSLSSGLSQIGVANKIIICSEEFPAKEILEFKPELVLGVGSWHSYEDFVDKPQKIGLKVVPWIVSDDRVEKFIPEYNQLSLILTPSSHCQKIFIKDGLKPEIIKVLPEAVDPNFWKKISEAQLVSFLALISISHQNLNLPFFFDLVKARHQEVPILFTTGGDATNKGAQEVIAALGKIKPEVPWLYLIKTWPSEGSFLHSAEEVKLAKKLGISNRIRYIVGEFSADFMRNLMNFCDIYVAPSRSEGFGLPLVEAQFCEKPVISMKATSTQEIVKDGLTGFLVSPKLVDNQPRADTDELTTVLQKMLTDSNLRKKMGKKAKVFVTENFSPMVIASKLIRYLEEKTA